MRLCLLLETASWLVGRPPGSDRVVWEGDEFHRASRRHATMNQGVIYVAFGQKYISEVLVSAASLKRSMPDLPVTLFCDVEVACPYVDQVVRADGDDSFPGCAAKIPHIAASPYDQTLFLDSDTYVCGTLAPLFALLDAFDLAAAHAPTRAIYEVEGVPDTFPELNTGVILFRRSPDVQSALSRWADLFLRYLERLRRDEIRWLRAADRRWHALNDQGVFREALYRSSVRVAILPPEYNCRFSAPGFVDGPVRILHGRGLDLASAATAINSVVTRRGYQERFGRLELMRHPEPSDRTYSFENIRYTLRRRGVRWTAEAGVRRLLAPARSRE